MSSRGRRYQDYLHDIHDAAIKARRFVEGMSYEQFAADDRTSYAVIRALEVIGEAARGVPQSAREQHTDVPWRDWQGSGTASSTAILASICGLYGRRFTRIYPP